MAEYAAKFEELVRYFPHYQGKDGESSKCVKFLNGLRPEVKQAVNYHGVHQFPLLVNIFWIWDEDSRDRVTYYRSAGPMVTALTIRGLFLWELQVVVVASPVLSPLISFVTDVVSRGTSPQIIPIEA